MVNIISKRDSTKNLFTRQAKSVTVLLWLVHFMLHFFQKRQIPTSFCSAVYSQYTSLVRSRYLKPYRSWPDTLSGGQFGVRRSETEPRRNRAGRCARRRVSARPGEWRRRGAQCQANATPASTSLTLSLSRSLTLPLSPSLSLIRSSVSLRVFQRTSIYRIDRYCCVCV